MPEHENPDHAAARAAAIEARRDFFALAYGWTVDDYGPGHRAFAGESLGGGLYYSRIYARARSGQVKIAVTRGMQG